MEKSGQPDIEPAVPEDVVSVESVESAETVERLIE